MSRRNGRILAFQALYSWDVNKSPLDELLTFSWAGKQNDENASDEDKALEAVTDKNAEENPYKQEEMTFASLLASGTINHIDEVDALIEQNLAQGWKKDRLNKVALAVLRISVYEIVYQKDCNLGIVVDEAISIAKQFGAEDVYKFINAVLDKIGKNERKTDS